MRIIFLSNDGYDVETQLFHDVSDLDIRVGSASEMSHFTYIDSLFRVGDLFLASRLHLYKSHCPAVRSEAHDVEIDQSFSWSPITIKDEIVLAFQILGRIFFAPFADIVVRSHGCVYLLSRKNSCISVVHSFSSMPEVVEALGCKACGA